MLDRRRISAISVWSVFLTPPGACSPGGYTAGTCLVLLTLLPPKWSGGLLFLFTAGFAGYLDQRGAVSVLLAFRMLLVAYHAGSLLAEIRR